MPCRKRKIKCDEKRPICRRCEIAGRHCEPSPTVSAEHPIGKMMHSRLFDGSPDVLDLLRLVPVSVAGLSGDDKVHIGSDMRLSISQRMASYVFELPSRVGYNAALDTAIGCVAAALRWRSSMRHYGVGSSEDFLSLYGKALQAIQWSIEDSVQCISAETLAATELLCMFEVSILSSQWDSEHPLKYMSNHHDRRLSEIQNNPLRSMHQGYTSSFSTEVPSDSQRSSKSRY